MFCRSCCCICLQNIIDQLNEAYEELGMRINKKKQNNGNKKEALRIPARFDQRKHARIDHPVQILRAKLK